MKLPHGICDNAAFHKSRPVRKYLEPWGHRFELHFLPKYAPQTNPIERVCWHLHQTITRNHQCATIEELLQEVYDWLAAQRFFPVETSLYRLAAETPRSDAGEDSFRMDGHRLAGIDTDHAAGTGQARSTILPNG